MNYKRKNIVSHNITTGKRGFVRFIIAIVVIAVVLQIFGINPLALWTDVIMPILVVLWESLLAVITFIISIIESIMNRNA